MVALYMKLSLLLQRLKVAKEDLENIMEATVRQEEEVAVQVVVEEMRLKRLQEAMEVQQLLHLSLAHLYLMQVAEAAVAVLVEVQEVTLELAVHVI